jgi:phosphoenolpyruvate carboxykinase (ATP)
MNNNKIDFNNTSITENTRSCYSLDIIHNTYQNELAPHPSTIIMLTCDAFGVLPPVSKLTIQQAIFHFISGYTAKIPGTESDILEPIATFSPCFGGPFMPRFIRDYADLFRERLEKFNSQCWFINTGWWGGPYGVGKRIDLSITRAILKNCIKNSFDSNNFIQSEYFDLYSPTFLEEEKTTSLNPIDKWENKAAYEEAANNLNNLFKENYSKFSNL